MEITFNKEGSLYVAIFRASNDFNLHIEKNKGWVNLSQTTVENGEFDRIKDVDIDSSDTVADIDFVGSIYPKWIRIVAEQAPKRCYVTFAS